MTESYSKSRQQAEIAFGKTQSQHLARARVVDEVDAIAAARDEKTTRLREARLAKEQQDVPAPATAPGTKRTKKS
ncbi:hypothetical protein AAIH46_12705 [Rhizobium sp. 0TCS1.26]|jgi:hypothetical protein|uniref:hypothetical protein n=1 Tax=Rhizobium sp. 0TCS1.26 TaxID=3142623 RepID=UPI0003927483|nr:hypothetical protein [uncultured organism]